MLRFNVLKNDKGGKIKMEELMVEKKKLINLKALAKIEGYMWQNGTEKNFFFQIGHKKNQSTLITETVFLFNTWQIVAIRLKQMVIAGRK